MTSSAPQSPKLPLQQPEIPPQAKPSKKDEESGKKELEEYFDGKELSRNDDLKGYFHKLVKGFVFVAFIAFSGVFLIRIYHLVAPPCTYWLPAEQVQGIDKILFSGAIGGFISRYLSKKM